MKNIFEIPKIEILKLETNDIITTSGTAGGGSNDGGDGGVNLPIQPF